MSRFAFSRKDGCPALLVALLVAGAASGLVATGSLKGALQGAVFGAVTAGFAQHITSAGNAAQVSAVLDSKSALAGFSLANQIATATRIKLAVGHALIGGVRAVVNGGKFLSGFLTAGISKFSTYATNGIVEGFSLTGKLSQGLVVATVGGIVAELSGGEFELGFLTAGLAFAVNEILTNNPGKVAKKRGCSGQMCKGQNLKPHNSVQSLKFGVGFPLVVDGNPVKF